MSKELEAFMRVKREAGMPYFSTLYDIDMWNEDLRIIETALKRLTVYADFNLLDKKCDEVDRITDIKGKLTTIDKVMDTQERLLASVSADEIKILSSVLNSQIKTTKKKLKALEIIKELFNFDFAIRFDNNQPMLRITNKLYEKLGKPFYYWELPITQEKYELLKEALK